MNTLVQALLPGSYPALIFGLAIGVSLLYTRGSIQRWARAWLTLLTFAYAAFGTQIGVDAVSAGLMRHDSHLTNPETARGANAIVLLTPGANTVRAGEREISGVQGAGALRILEAARLYHLMGSPWLILSGGPDPSDRPSTAIVAREALVRLGVPEDRILLEPLSRNTYEHTQKLRPILQAYDVQRFVLVTSPVHMLRAAATFRAAGYDVLPSPSSARSDLPPMVRTPWPKLEHLEETAAAFHEYVGLFYYWVRGWL